MKTRSLLIAAFLLFSIFVNANEKPYREIIWNALLCTEFATYSNSNSYFTHRIKLRELAKKNIEEWADLIRLGKINIATVNPKSVTDKFGVMLNPSMYDIRFNESDEYIFGLYSGVVKDRVNNVIGDAHWDDYQKFYEMYNCNILARE